jgi:hypothetical protein
MIVAWGLVSAIRRHGWFEKERKGRGESGKEQIGRMGDGVTGRVTAGR